MLRWHESFQSLSLTAFDGLTPCYYVRIQILSFSEVVGRPLANTSGVQDDSAAFFGDH